MAFQEVIDRPFVLSLYKRLNGIIEPGFSDSVPDVSDIPIDEIQVTYDDKRDAIVIKCKIPGNHEKKITYSIYKTEVVILYNENKNSVEINHLIKVLSTAIWSSSDQVLPDGSSKQVFLNFLPIHALVYNTLRQIFPSLMNNPVVAARINSRPPLIVAEEVSESSKKILAFRKACGLEEEPSKSNGHLSGHASSAAQPLISKQVNLEMQRKGEELVKKFHLYNIDARPSHSLPDSSKPSDQAELASEQNSNVQTTKQTLLKASQVGSNQSSFEIDQPKVTLNEDLSSKSKPTAFNLLEEDQKKRLLAFEQEFTKTLDFLQKKAQADFSGDAKSQKEAFETTEDLIKVLKDEVSLFIDNPSQETYNKLKEDSTKSIAKARLVLDKHRDWTKILLSVLASICTGGLYVVAAAIDRVITGKWRLFSTDTSNRITSVENSISASPMTQKG